MGGGGGGAPGAAASKAWRPPCPLPGVNPPSALPPLAACLCRSCWTSCDPHSSRRTIARRAGSAGGWAGGGGARGRGACSTQVPAPPYAPAGGHGAPAVQHPHAPPPLDLNCRPTAGERGDVAGGRVRHPGHHAAGGAGRLAPSLARVMAGAAPPPPSHTHIPTPTPRSGARWGLTITPAASLRRACCTPPPLGGCCKPPPPSWRACAGRGGGARMGSCWTPLLRWRCRGLRGWQWTLSSRWRGG